MRTLYSGKTPQISRLSEENSSKPSSCRIHRGSSQACGGCDKEQDKNFPAGSTVITLRKHNLPEIKQHAKRDLVVKGDKKDQVFDLHI